MESTISEENPLKEEGMIGKKKSILVIRGAAEPEYKRGSSKVTIQWEKGVKQLDDKLKTHRKTRLHALGLLVAQGSRRSHVLEIMQRLKTYETLTLKKPSQEMSHEQMSIPKFDSFVQELWYGMLHKSPDGGAELTLDQQVKLEILKYKIKAENDQYLKNHPELDVLLTLVYRKLLKTKPENPQKFVANYVHYLNTHREELVLDEIDVPFDRAVQPEKPESELEKDEKEEIKEFARELINKCAALAMQGAAFVNVSTIIDSILRTVSPSEDNIKLESRRSAEVEVSDILFSLLESVAQARTISAEIIVEDIMDSLVENVWPSLDKDSDNFLEVKDSVEEFVRSLLLTVTNRVARETRLQDRLLKYEQSISKFKRPDSINNVGYDKESITSEGRSILKKRQSRLHLEKNESKVQFKS